MTAREDIKKACKQAGLSVKGAGKVAGVGQSTIYSWTAPEGSKALKKPLPATVLGFRLILALHGSKNGVFVDKNLEVTEK